MYCMKTLLRQSGMCSSVYFQGLSSKCVGWECWASASKPFTRQDSKSNYVRETETGYMNSLNQHDATTCDSDIKMVDKQAQVEIRNPKRGQSKKSSLNRRKIGKNEIQRIWE